MLESSAALYSELGPSTAHCTETNMEKNPNNSTNTKVPPRSSSTGPAPADSKPKTGESTYQHTHTRFSNLMCAYEAKHSLPCGLLGPSSSAEVVYLVWLTSLSKHLALQQSELWLMIAHCTIFEIPSALLSCTTVVTFVDADTVIHLDNRLLQT